MEVLKKPILTEKMTAMSEKLGRYAFMVDKNANKIQIKKAIEDMYGVNVAAVNTMVYAGKSKSRHTKKGFIQGRTTGFKKAIISLAEGSTIDFYSNI